MTRERERERERERRGRFPLLLWNLTVGKNTIRFWDRGGGKEKRGDRGEER